MAAPPRYTEEQRTALANAVLNDGMKVSEAIRAAAAGQLGIPPYIISKEAAYRAVDKARTLREAHAATQNPADSIPDLARRLLAITAPEVGRLENQAANGKYNATAVRNISRNLQELSRLLSSKTPQRTKTETDPSGKTTTANDLLGVLRNAAAATQPDAATNESSSTGQQPG